MEQQLFFVLGWGAPVVAALFALTDEHLAQVLQGTGPVSTADHDGARGAEFEAGQRVGR